MHWKRQWIGKLFGNLEERNDFHENVDKKESNLRTDNTLYRYNTTVKVNFSGAHQVCQLAISKHFISEMAYCRNLGTFFLSFLGIEYYNPFTKVCQNYRLLSNFSWPVFFYISKWCHKWYFWRSTEFLSHQNRKKVPKMVKNGHFWPLFANFRYLQRANFLKTHQCSYI